jgi:hypothetical protein
MINMPFNGKTLKPEEKSYLIQLIKSGNSKTKCIEMLMSKFGRTIDFRNISRFARINKLSFKVFQGDAFTKEEEGIVKGLWLVDASPLRRNRELKSRGNESMIKKIRKMKLNGEVNEGLKEKIKKDILKGTSLRAIEKKYGIPKRYVAEFKETVESSKVEMENIKRWENDDVSSVLDSLEAHKEKMRKLESKQEFANITITTQNKYVAVMFLSDIHLENINTDAKLLRRDLEIVKNTKDFYVGFGGDLIDNFFVGPHKEGIVEACMPPMQARIVAGKLITNNLKGKLLWTILGCHDAWDRDYADYNLPQHVARKMNIPYLGHGGDINLTLKNGNKGKGILYSIHARHKYKGGNGDNGTAPCKNVLRNIDAKFDIVAISHNHIAEIKIEHFLRKPRVFVRTGSYKLEDRYSQMLGFEKNDFDSQIPVVVLNTQTKEMKVVTGVKNAADLLKSLNRAK